MSLVIRGLFKRTSSVKVGNPFHFEQDIIQRHSDWIMSGKNSSSPPERPPPPIVGKVTHHSVELYWEEALKEAAANSKSRIRVALQEEDKSGSWGNVYTGYSKKHVIDSLDTWTQYKYRVRFMNEFGNADWSAATIVSTTQEPITGKHIHKAVFMDNLDQLEAVLNSGESDHMKNLVDTPDEHGFSPLMTAAKKGYRRIMDALITYGADVNFQNDAGKTPLMLASYEGKREAVKELLERGATMEIHDRGGSTALHWAMDGGNLDLIEHLLDQGADIESKDHNGWTPLLRTAAVGGNSEAAERLLRRRKDLVNHRDNHGKTALMIAVVNGYHALISTLLNNGADIMVKNDYDKTAYEMALSMERRRVIQILQDHMDKKGIKYFT